jgi:hypothetical protein
MRLGPLDVRLIWQANEQTVGRKLDHRNRQLRIKHALTPNHDVGPLLDAEQLPSVGRDHLAVGPEELHGCHR